MSLYWCTAYQQAGGGRVVKGQDTWQVKIADDAGRPSGMDHLEASALTLSSVTCGTISG